jgi:hypothetical protein
MAVQGNFATFHDNVCLLGDGRFSPTEETGSEHEHQVLTLGGLSGRRPECSSHTPNTQAQILDKSVECKKTNIRISGTRLATKFPKQPGGCKTTIVSALNNQTEGSSPRRIRFNQNLETSNFAPAVEFTQTGGIYSQLACNSFE